MLAQIERFTLKNAAITADLRQVLNIGGLAATESDLERAADSLVDRHLRQVNYEIRTAADRMAEFYKTFYLLENHIREFVAGVLEEAVGLDWWSKAVPPTVRQNADRSRTRESKEGLPARSSTLIDYTTFGELSEIVKANWAVFGGLFPNSDVERFERVMQRLNLARGPIAHCGMLPEEEVVRLKLAIRDWFRLAE